MKLLAPNGNISNLTSEQYRLVRTDAFKDWFGDWENDPKNASKVVDENGEPLVVYHGSVATDIDVFDRDKSIRIPSGLKEFGIYFATNKELAKLYSSVETSNEHNIEISQEIKKLRDQLLKTRSNRDFYAIQDEIELLTKYGRVYPVFLNLRKIETFDAKEETNIEAWRNLEVKASYKWASGRDAMDFLKEGKFGVSKVDGIKAENIIDMSIGGSYKESKEYMEAREKYLGDVYLVFDGQPQNIKLADGSNVTFDGENPDIRYFKGGEVESYNKWKSTDWSKIPNSKERERAFRVLNWIEDDRINYSKLNQEDRDKIEDYLENDYLKEALTYILEEEFKGLENQYYVLEEEEEIVDEKSFLKVLNSDDYKGLREGLKKYNLTHRSFDNKNVDELVKDYIDGLNTKQLIDYFIFDEEKWGELLFNSDLRDQIDFSDLYNSILDSGAVFTEEEEEQQYDMFAEAPDKSISIKKEPIAVEVEKEESLTEQLTKEIEALNEYLEDAKEEDSKELISELEDRIEFLEELKEEAEENNPIKKNKGGKAGSAVGESRLMNLPESSIIALNSHLIGLSLQISELIQARIEYLQNMSDEDYSKLKEGSYDFKEKVSEPQSYEEWFEEWKAIDKENNDASNAIQSFPRNEMGLTPDEVKDTEEYKVANKNWNTSWKRLQEFNKKSPKKFQKRQATERRQAMMSKNKV